MKLSLRLCLAALLVAPFVAFAQPKKSVPVVTAKDAGQVDISNAPDGTATYDDAQGVARITKNVVITQRGEDLVVYAQDVVYSRARNQANATGQLKVVTRNSTIRGQKLFADFDERRFTISGNVVITSHGKNDGAAGGLRAEANKKPIRVLCDQVVWDYDTRQATATGNIKIIQGANEGTCDSIVYDENKNIVSLRGNVEFGDDKNRTFLSQNIVVYIDSNKIFSDSRVRISFKDKDGMNGDGAPKPTRAPKTPMAFQPEPNLPADVLNGIAPPPTATPRPVVPEAPDPTPPADDEEVPNTAPKSD